MVEYICWVKGCEFEIKDEPHIDACLQTLKEHFRGAHPTRYLNVGTEGDLAARYNQTWEEYIEAQLGNDWANPVLVNEVLYYAQSLTREREGVKPNWRKSTIEEATAWIAANQQAAQEVANGGNARPRFRPGGAVGRRIAGR